MRVLAFAGTRADLFPLGPVLESLATDPSVELHIVTAIGFEPGTAEERIQQAGVPAGSFTHHDLGLYLQSATAAEQLRLGPLLSEQIATLLPRIAAEAVVVLGDRWELLYLLPPVVISGVRLIHLHGGEVTEGALDERVRHAVTKLADQHCVSTDGSARRVAQLGEAAERIHRTGAPGLDRFREQQPLTAQEFEAEFGQPLRQPLLLVTYHPPTAGGVGRPGELARQVFEAAIAAAKTVILTYPGFDAGRDEIIAELQRLNAQQLTGVVVRESLGPLYPRVMATAQAMIGNSSSGILEAASFQMPVVDVGERQRGREHGANVLHSSDDPAALQATIEKALSSDFQQFCQSVINPYGDSHAAERISQVVLASGEQALSKAFVDCDARKVDL
ncbi:UDP-N-acetylglucosamine 2-epimerase [Psychromicrobium lacuslunae]|uniref:UDP-N-acetylglucosamine 2-epimerase n=1 Tax=Psychromicrobium lacuslunae TaxID=1618207 RepID=UPI0005D3422D|nr:UDP-N-acetylglucosamine 2-epimerase [Psychromicrobium lacuslunae]